MNYEWEKILEELPKDVLVVLCKRLLAVHHETEAPELLKKLSEINSKRWRLS